MFRLKLAMPEINELHAFNFLDHIGPAQVEGKLNATWNAKFLCIINQRTGNYLASFYSEKVSFEKQFVHVCFIRLKLKNPKDKNIKYVGIPTENLNSYPWSNTDTVHKYQLEVHGWGGVMKGPRCLLVVWKLCHLSEVFVRKHRETLASDLYSILFLHTDRFLRTM